MEKYRILLAEDRIIHRLFFENLFRDSDRYTLIGIEDNMDEVVKRFDHTPADIILTAAADKNGRPNFSAVETFKREHPSMRIIIITDLPEHSYLQRAEDCGADSFWYADEKQPFISVLDRMMEGVTVFPEGTPCVTVGHVKSCDFSEKELIILREVAKGYSNKEIAKTLQMSYYTVRDYVKGMLEKTELPNRTALAVGAVSSGMIVLEK